jgi:putative spermidine/putrescine transport system permease protein
MSGLRIIVVLLPTALVVLGVFLAGMFIATRSSLPISTYRTVFNDPEVRAAFSFTLKLTVLSTVSSALLGIVAALFMHQLARRNHLLRFLFQIPLSVPHLATALILLALIAPSGLLARFFVATPQDFPVLVGDTLGIGVILAYTLKETPFVALVIMATLARKSDELELVAQNLGASRWQRFRHVTLPIITPPTLFSSLLVFSYVFGAFEIPFVLGRQYPTVLAIVGNRKFSATDLSDRPEAFAIAVVMTLVAALFVWLFLRLWHGPDDSGKPLPF